MALGGIGGNRPKTKSRNTTRRARHDRLSDSRAPKMTDVMLAALLGGVTGGLFAGVVYVAFDWSWEFRHKSRQRDLAGRPYNEKRRRT